MTYRHAPSFDVWLRHQYVPGAAYDTAPIAALASDALRRAGGRQLRTPTALVSLLREYGASPAIYATAELATAQYARTVLTIRATEAADPDAATSSVV